MSVHITSPTTFPGLLDTRDLQVTCLQAFDEAMGDLRGVTEGVHFAFVTPDASVVMSASYDAIDDLFTDEHWLSRAIISAVGEDTPITGFMIGFTPRYGMAVTVGLSPTGRVEQAATLFGQNVMEEVCSVQFQRLLAAEAKRLWGEAWSPLP